MKKKFIAALLLVNYAFSAQIVDKVNWDIAPYIPQEIINWVKKEYERGRACNKIIEHEQGPIQVEIFGLENEKMRPSVKRNSPQNCEDLQVYLQIYNQGNRRKTIKISWYKNDRKASPRKQILHQITNNIDEELSLFSFLLDNPS